MKLNAELKSKSSLLGVMKAEPPVPFCWDLENYGWDTGHWFSFRARYKNTWGLKANITVRIRFNGEFQTTWIFKPNLVHPDPAPVKAEDYTRLVPWQHRRPKFLALLRTVISPAVDLQNLEYNFSRYFDVDGAVGVQLDKIGEWVGISRIIENVPVNDNLGSATLPDYIFRCFVKAKIAANSWDGTKEKISEVWETAFGDLSKIAVTDNLDMSMTVIMTGIDTDEVFMEMLRRGLLPLRPAGVMVSYIIADPSSKRIFAWDRDTPIFGGWDSAGWMWKEVTYE